MRAPRCLVHALPPRRVAHSAFAGALARSERRTTGALILRVCVCKSDHCRALLTHHARSIMMQRVASMRSAAVRVAALAQPRTAAAATRSHAGAVQSARTLSTVAPLTDAAAVAAPSSSATATAAAAPSTAASSTGPVRPPRRRKHWADAHSMLLLKERGLVRAKGVRPSWRPAEGGSGQELDQHLDGPRPRAALQRGAPPPRPILPTPPALAAIDKPWMQSQLNLEFVAPPSADDAAQHPQPSVRINIAQWTGMELGPASSWKPKRKQPRRSGTAKSSANKQKAVVNDGHDYAEEDAGEEEGPDAAAADADDAEADPDAFEEEPEWTAEQLAVEAELAAQADAGSGAIAWDAGVHLAHWVHALPQAALRHFGPVLELGSGTGALGLAVEAMLRASPSATQATAPEAAHNQVVLTDGGKVMELLQQNAKANNSNGQTRVGRATTNANDSPEQSAHSLLLCCDMFFFVLCVPAAVVSSLNWSDVPSFLSQLPSSFSASSASPSLPPFFRTILCSELLDSIPGPANGHRAFDATSFATLVRALTDLSQHSLQAQRRLQQSQQQGASTSAPSSPAPVPVPGVQILFTFEQRGVLTLDPVQGILEASLFEPLRAQGFRVHQVLDDKVYTQASALCLFSIKME